MATAASLGDPGVGYQSWDFSLLSEVVFWGLNVNPDGSLMQGDTAWNVWHSVTGSGLVNAAHAAGVKVLLGVVYQDPGLGMCQALDAGATTIAQLAAQLLGADGVDVDYEGVNQTCPDGVDARTKLTRFIGQLRAAGVGYLVVNTYAGSAEDPAGFFDLAGLGPVVDAFFVMAYGLESLNGPCPTCMGPTAPLSGGPTYGWNVTRVAADYAPWAGQSILAVPYYGIRSCVAGPNPPPNAQALGTFGADPYTTIAGYPTNPSVTGWNPGRDLVDPAGQEPWVSFTSSDPQLQCTVEEYWDDPTSLATKYDLINASNLRGAGVFALDFGGGTAGLWDALRSHFTNPGATPPGAPTGVSAVPGKAQAVVSWTPPASNGGSPITGYTVTAAPGGQTATVGGGVTSATVTGLTNGTSYAFTVTATNALGVGPASIPSPPVTPWPWLEYWGTPTGYDGNCSSGGRYWADGVPGDGTWGVGWHLSGLPANTAVTVQADVRCDGTATNALYEVDDPQGGHHWFRVNQSLYTAGTALAPLGTWTTDSNGNLLVQLWNGSNPGGRVTAAGLVISWNGGTCDPTGQCHTVPGAPTAVAATPGNGQATVSWTRPSSDGGSPITGYTVTAAPGVQTASVNGTTTTATVIGLTNGTAYTFTVTATNATGTGPASAPSAPIVPAIPPPPTLTVEPDRYHVDAVLPGYSSFVWVVKTTGLADAYSSGASPFLIDPLTYGGKQVRVSARAAGPASNPWAPEVQIDVPPPIPTLTVEADRYHVDAVLPGVSSFVWVVKTTGLADAYSSGASPFLIDPLTYGGRQVRVSARAAGPVSNPWAPEVQIDVPPVHLYGVSNAGGAVGNTFTDATSLGIGLDRVELDYGDPTATMDTRITAATGHGLTPLPVPVQYGDIAQFDLAGWQQWAATVATRYGPGGSLWSGRSDGRYAPAYFEVLNEPYGDWFYTRRDPAAYATFFAAITSAAKQANPAARFLISGYAGAFKDQTGTLSTQTWDALLSAAADGPAALRLADGVTSHPYGASPPAGTTRSPCTTTSRPCRYGSPNSATGSVTPSTPPSSTSPCRPHGCNATSPST